MEKQTYDGGSRQLRIASGIFGKGQYSLGSFLAGWRMKAMGVFLTAFSLLLIAGCSGDGNSGAVGDSSVEIQTVGKLGTASQLSDGMVGCDKDSDCDGLPDTEELDNCKFDHDCDNDTVKDGDEVAGCVLKPDCDSDSIADDVDIDDDGDGLIEIHTAAELDSVRYQLRGAGFKRTAEARSDQTGCGNGRSVGACFGYELVRDISLTAYINSTYSGSGWRPIAPDGDTDDAICDGGRFAGTFEGNGFVVRGLFINRTDEDCIGLFGQTSGKIYRLGVVADRIIGRDYVGGLVGQGRNAEITKSYVVSGEVSGRDRIGGLVGHGWSTKIVRSYVVNGLVSGEDGVGSLVGHGWSTKIVRSYGRSGEVRGHNRVGGLVGQGASTEIVQSYGVSGLVNGSNGVGGLVGHGISTKVVQSYGVSGLVRGSTRVGGLVGQGTSAEIVHSYGVSSLVSGSTRVGGLVGTGGSAQDSYWDSEISSRSNDGSSGSQAQDSTALRSPTDYAGIYSSWDDGAISENETIADVDRNGSIWCDEDSSDVIEADEMRNSSHAMGDNQIWDFGKSDEYPVIRCTVGGLVNQRAWWYPDGADKLQFNQPYLDQWLQGSPSLPNYDKGDSDNGGEGGSTVGGGGGIDTLSHVEWSIIPFARGLSIRWHDLDSFSRGGLLERLSFNLTHSDLSVEKPYDIAVANFMDGIYNLTGLADGGSYKFASKVTLEYSDNILVVRPIAWSWKENEVDNGASGIVVGINYDGDGRADSIDTDDDNDGVDDERNGMVLDNCPRGLLDWVSNGTNDMDGDGCRDGDEGLDRDNDGVLNEDEVAGCELSSDCDGDNVTDAVDIDMDGDGLIELRTAAELDAVRHVLDGSGYKGDTEAMLNQTGCGDGGNNTACFGYELVRNISLADYIAKIYPTSGWRPIAHDTDTRVSGCQGDAFTGTFDGNGFEISGLLIDRTGEDCIGLFGLVVGGVIRNVGVVADRVVGGHYVGTIVGYGEDTDFIQSYVVSGEVRGDDRVGGLVGGGANAEIIYSYTLIGEVRGGDRVGGLVGHGSHSEIIYSYVLIGEVRGGDRIGGLVGHGWDAVIIQSYGVIGSVSGKDYYVGGLVGFGRDVDMVQSYGVIGLVSGVGRVGGLVGSGSGAAIIHSYVVSGELSGERDVGSLVGYAGSFQISYWDSETSGRDNDASRGSQAQSSMALRSPTGYGGIYSSWDDGAIGEGTIRAGIDHNGNIWCDEDLSGVIEADEMRDANHTNGDNRVWDFGTSTDYPALRCTGDSLADQRAWWYLDSMTHEPRLNIDIFPIDISERLDRDRDGVIDTGDNCPLIANSAQLDTDNDGVGDLCDRDELVDCKLTLDCDNDGVVDAVDIDDDGDGLIEIRTARELDAVRYVLDGSGYKANAMAMLNQTGCGDGRYTGECSGYELVGNISLTDYITETYPISGWLPIAPDTDTTVSGCQGEAFTGTFDSNGFVISGLFINRTQQDCIGLFGQVVYGTIRNVGVVADRVVGRDYVGILVGSGWVIDIVRSYVVSGVVSGNYRVGGLVGRGSYSDFIQSYVVVGEVRGDTVVGGLVGNSWNAEIIQSYVVSGVVSGEGYYVGGLVGRGRDTEVLQSYGVSGGVSGERNVGGLVGGSGIARDSYWDSETSGRDSDDARGSQAQSSMALRSPTSYHGIYSSWDDGAISEGTRIAGIDHDGTIWCDEDRSSMIEDDEKRDSNHTMGDNRVWDFGTDTDYPALRCTGDSLTAQRSWWFLNNVTHKPQLNVDIFSIDISERLDRDRDGIANAGDNCPLVANGDQLDTDNDGMGDVCDRDKDGDGVVNGDELAGCELISDCDGDRVSDTGDNCPLVANSDQLDTDNDSVGDVCDGDKDDDGVVNGDEAAGCELVSDCDGDNVTDAVDIDADGDGLIELRTAAELDAVRYVLDGRGYKVSRTAVLDQTGCGDGGNNTVCFGYELVHNISLADYIAKVYPTSGWRPIAPDTDARVSGCQGDRFTGTFDGNGFEISGLLIDRTGEDCIGLFGLVVGGVIRNVGVVADRVVGGHYVGTIVGYGEDTDFIQSYVVSGEVRGDDRVGGLVGGGANAEIIYSYTLIGEVRGGDRVGGLVGHGSHSEIIYSYVLIGEVRGGDRIGGLVGHGWDAVIIQSYGVIGSVSGKDYYVGGLVGFGRDVDMVQSYGVIGLVSGVGRVGGLVGSGSGAAIIHSYVVSGELSGERDVGSLVGYAGSFQISYWDSETSGRDNDASRGSQAQSSMALRSPTGYGGIYSSWDDGAIGEGTIRAGIDHNGNIWCDEDLSGVIEADEMRDANHTNGDNRVWDFGTSTDYPALRCTGDSLADQRAWWYLDSMTHEPRLNIDIFPIDISERLDRDRDGVIDTGDNCPLIANSAQLDMDNDGVGDACDRDELVDCKLTLDCDNDGVVDAVDIDDDGDGLIEIRTARELDAVRYVLDGSGYKANAMAMLNQTGCGDGRYTGECSGYELVGNISLTDYITETYPISGWLPIAPDTDTTVSGCQGEAFTGTFDSNGFVISGLFINRTQQDCIGLFGQVVYGTIRNVGVVADRVVGRDYVGILMGSGWVIDIVRSYVVSGVVSGNYRVGGLVGRGSYSDFIQSYVVVGEVRGDTVVGGLVGNSWNVEIIQSYVVSGVVSGEGYYVGGLVGRGRDTEVLQSYGVSGVVSGERNVGGLVGGSGIARDSYWDSETSGRDSDDARGSQAQSSMALRSPTSYHGIYSSWDDGAISEGTRIAGVDHDGTIWCDEDRSSMIEDDEKRDSNHTMGDNRVWDFGTDTDYPAIRCTGEGLADQRAWWYLNATHKPQLNQTRLDAWLDGSLP